MDIPFAVIAGSGHELNEAETVMPPQGPLFSQTFCFPHFMGICFSRR